jgi:glycosyltransferase involved in cell wall biosynthesis
MPHQSGVEHSVDLPPSSQASHSLSIVIPVYNSERSIVELVRGVHEVFENHGSPVEIILVDDGSTDGSWAAIASLAADHGGVKAVRMMRNFGQHNALLAGMRLAKHEVIVTMDDDLQHPPDQIPLLLQALTGDVDLVYGFAEREEHGQLRSAASRLVKLALSFTLKSSVARRVSSFRAFRRGLSQAFAHNADPSLTLDVLLSWATTRIVVVSVRMEQRRYGASNYTVKRLVQHALNMITGYSAAPLRFVAYLGVAFSGFGFCILVFVLARYALLGTRVPGFTFLSALIAVFSGAQMFALGIIGEYLGRMHFRSMNRPQYLIRETIPEQLPYQELSPDDVNGLKSETRCETEGDDRA